MCSQTIHSIIINGGVDWIHDSRSIMTDVLSEFNDETLPDVDCACASIFAVLLVIQAPYITFAACLIEFNHCFVRFIFRANEGSKMDTNAVPGLDIYVDGSSVCGRSVECRRDVVV